MAIRILIIRHGNTFDRGDVITRVGRRTDLSLSKSGREQADKLGKHMAEKYGEIDIAYTGTLKRTRETMGLVLDRFKEKPEVISDAGFDEIDYGPDENQPEDEVIGRIGEEALRAWNEECVPPPGWDVDVKKIVSMWQNFFTKASAGVDNQTIAIVTSNGIARFAPFPITDLENFRLHYKLKLSTAAYGEMIYENNIWHIKSWNLKAL